jgi:hypothetical protein
MAPPFRFLWHTNPNEFYALIAVILLLWWTALSMGFLTGICIWMGAWLYFIGVENNFIHSAQVWLALSLYQLILFFLSFVIIFSSNFCSFLKHILGARESICDIHGHVFGIHGALYP